MGSHSSALGFLLQAGVRVVAQPDGSERAVLHVYGRLESGQTFLIRDGRCVPHLYVRTRDEASARGVVEGTAGISWLPTPRRTLRGEPVSRIEVATPAGLGTLARRLTAAGIATFEADVSLVSRYLLQRGIRGSLEIHGAPRPGRVPGERVDVVYDDPETAPAALTPPLRALALRTQVHPETGAIRAIALCGAGVRELLRVGSGPGALTDAGLPPGLSPLGARPASADSARRGLHDEAVFPSERALLEGFVTRVHEIDPDVLTGWDVLAADLQPLVQAAQRCRVALELGRGPGALRVSTGEGRGPPRGTLAGRVVLDGLQLVRGAFVALEDHDLDAAARRVLGDEAGAPGPASADTRDGGGHGRLLHDAARALAIVERLRLVELFVRRSRLCGLPVDRVHASVAAFDFLYMSELHRRGVVTPTQTIAAASDDPAERVVGGAILTPQPGLYRDVVALDFRSLYPSLIRTFQIDPLGLIDEDGDAALPPDEPPPIVAPSGARFRRQLGVMTVLLEPLFATRAAAKAAGDTTLSQAIKILMNSLFGVLGSPACRFHRPELANAVTSFGRALLGWTRDRIEGYGYRVVYGDTDSVFVQIGEGDRLPSDTPAGAAALHRLGQELAARLTADLREHLRTAYAVESFLELELHTAYRRLHLQRLRSARRAPAEEAEERGAAKRYAGLAVERTGETRLSLIGLEAVRRDATELARRVQRQLYTLLFTERPAAELTNWLQRVVADLRRGALDDQLVYRRALRKELGAYTKTTPPHVAAARKLGTAVPVGRLVAYVQTTAGPEPAAARRGAIDYAHYVEKQIKPVAQPILALLKIDFDRAINVSQQLRLF